MLVLRHGETTWNAERRWSGQGDPPLTEAGRAATRRRADELSQEGFTGVATSDLLRARQTATILAAILGLPPPVVVPGLREVDTGQWTGRTSIDIEDHWPGLADRWRAGELEQIPGGEHRDTFDRRVVVALTGLEKSHPEVGEKPLVVGHAGTLRTLERHSGVVLDRQNLRGVWIEVDGGVLRCLNGHA